MKELFCSMHFTTVLCYLLVEIQGVDKWSNDVIDDEAERQIEQ
jgi:hypothetical protein